MGGYFRNPEIVHETVDGETIVIDLATGTYFSLRGSAPALWNEIGDGASLETVVRRLASVYDGPPAELAAAVETFLDRLEAEGLVVRGDPPAGVSAAVEPAAQRAPFEPPLLERYDDLQELLLLDPVHMVEDAGWPQAAPVDEPA